MTDERIKQFEIRHERLKTLSDDELKDHFWDLCYKVVDPIIDLARTHTSPSIERSILLRMGIDSAKSHGIVDAIHQAGLLGKGAGHVLLKLCQKLDIDVKAAGDAILENKEVLNGLFEEA
ncbi:MAG TPA: ornithine aminomutase [Anaerolineaceae bacterium]|jgi:D-ornithine 4,5-aminomutase subunit alpha|nr:ornithine aminomutase [Anaerolineaceae bacterium]